MNATEPTTSRLFDTRKKQLFFFVALLAAVLAGAFMVYAILVTPLRQPYRDALAQYKNVYNANIAVMHAGNSLNPSSATDEQFTKGIETVKTRLASLRTESDALGKKSVLQDGEGKALYEDFSKHLDAYIAHNTTLVDAMHMVRPIVYECSQKLTNATKSKDGVAAMRSCETKFAALTTVPDKDYQAFADASHKVYASLAKTLAKRVALADPNGADAAQDKAYATHENEILQTLENASTTLAQNSLKHRQAVDITESAAALDDYLQRKSRVL